MTDNYPSQLRNKLIAEAFYLTKNIEKYGSGMIRIRKELEGYPELTFKIEQTGGGVLVTFSSSEGVNSLYQCIKENPGRRIPDYSKTLGVPVKTLNSVFSVSSVVKSKEWAKPTMYQPQQKKNNTPCKILYFKTTESTEVWLPPNDTETGKIIIVIDRLSVQAQDRLKLLKWKTKLKSAGI